MLFNLIHFAINYVANIAVDDDILLTVMPELSSLTTAIVLWRLRNTIAD